MDTEYFAAMEQHLRTIKAWIIFWSLMVIVTAVLGAIYFAYILSQLGG